jgi:hypothetical protein
LVPKHFGAKTFASPHFNRKKKKKAGCGAATCHLSGRKHKVGRLVDQAGLDKGKQDSISKIIRANRVASMAQVTEHLPSKCKALCSNPGTAKK